MKHVRFSAAKTALVLALTFGGCLTGCVMLAAAALIEGSLFDFSATTWRGYSSIVFLGLDRKSVV